MTRKRIYNLFFLLELIFLLFCLSFKELFSSNLSRLFNKNSFTYFIINSFSLAYGYNLYLSFKKENLRLKYLALIMPVLGSIIAYNPSFPNALSSNIHLFFAYVSCIGIIILEFILLFYFNLNLKLKNILRNVYIIILGICLYLYIDQMFVSLLNELIFLTGIAIINFIMMNYEVKNE